jgi:hypothetical protein
MTDIALYTIDEVGLVHFSLKNITRTIEGPEEALQLVAWAFFTDPGSCFYARQDGGGAKKTFLGKNIPAPQQLRADAAIVVRSTFETVRRAQRPGRAAKATVVGLDLIDAFGDDTGRIRCKVRIRLLSGNSFNVTLPGVTP